MVDPPPVRDEEATALLGTTARVLLEVETLPPSRLSAGKINGVFLVALPTALFFLGQIWLFVSEYLGWAMMGGSLLISLGIIARAENQLGYRELGWISALPPWSMRLHRRFAAEDGSFVAVAVTLRRTGSCCVAARFERLDEPAARAGFRESARRASGRSDRDYLRNRVLEAALHRELGPAARVVVATNGALGLVLADRVGEPSHPGHIAAAAIEATLGSGVSAEASPSLAATHVESVAASFLSSSTPLLGCSLDRLVDAPDLAREEGPDGGA